MRDEYELAAVRSIGEAIPSQCRCSSLAGNTQKGSETARTSAQAHSKAMVFAMRVCSEDMISHLREEKPAAAPPAFYC
jgi:hypothetical protein